MPEAEEQNYIKYERSVKRTKLFKNEQSIIFTKLRCVAHAEKYKPFLLCSGSLN